MTSSSVNSPLRSVRRSKGLHVSEFQIAYNDCQLMIATHEYHSGFRFSLIEVKAILYMLVRNFNFAEGVPTEKILRKTSIVTRPFIKDGQTKEPQMPVYMRPIA